MINPKRQEIDRRQGVNRPIVDEKRNSLLQNRRSESLRSNSLNISHHRNSLPVVNKVHRNGNCSPSNGESLCFGTCGDNKPKYLTCILITVLSVILTITAVSISVGLFLYHKEWWNDSPPKGCFQLCLPKDINDGIRERYAIKKWVVNETATSRGTDGKHCPLGIIGNGSEKTYTLFPYPIEEPKYDPSIVGEELLLSPLIQAGRFEEVRKLSEVKGLSTDIISYSGFITIENIWRSHLFFWFFPAHLDGNEYGIEGWYII